MEIAGSRVLLTGATGGLGRAIAKALAYAICHHLGLLPSCTEVGRGGLDADRAFGAGVESFRIEQRALVVVAKNAHIHLHDEIDAFAWVWPVTDDIA